MKPASASASLSTLAFKPPTARPGSGAAVSTTAGCLAGKSSDNVGSALTAGTAAFAVGAATGTVNGVVTGTGAGAVGLAAVGASSHKVGISGAAVLGTALAIVGISRLGLLSATPSASGKPSRLLRSATCGLAQPFRSACVVMGAARTWTWALGNTLSW